MVFEVEVLAGDLTLHLRQFKKLRKFFIIFFIKALQKAEYSDFLIFVKFKTRNIPYIPYISKILCQNQIFIFAKYSFRLKFIN
jgi:hypothetical protein